MATWTILTCEYPPNCGGVGDYTAQVAGALAAAGDRVTVVCPPASSDPLAQRDVDVMVLSDVYGAKSRQAIDARLEERRSTLLVQYVPTGYGMRGANVPFTRWILSRARQRRDDVRVMFHEPYFELTSLRVRQNVLALAQRLMARTLLHAASRTYISTDAWRRYLTPYASPEKRRMVTLPIPSAVPKCDRPAEILRRRARLTTASTDHLVGHFGTYGSHVAPMLKAALLALLAEHPDLSAVCVGAGSDEFVRAFATDAPALAARLHATGRASREDVAVVLSACDLLLQPYPDGVTTRRTSVMAGLMNGCAVLTTTGHLTEQVWSDSRSVALTPAGDTQEYVHAASKLLSDDDARAALAARADKTYRDRFALAHTIARLRGSAQSAAA